ncbi:hypothetical protein ACTJJ0_31425 [Chitinophaga sp. 22321]|uniref:DUF4251 domain-containing protein n=1 Tax=Chitinophaga hostae TaxID=2831022 RepID=A0ABS5JBN4_9BACT|nr:hypothetical protein [Chitinophaga hostae]MBS0031872.1 hypothetical protein [Chitinophaga hostae]
MLRHFSRMSACVTCMSLMLFVSESNAQQAFTRLQQSADSTYGYAADNPVRLKNGNTDKSIINGMNYLSGLVTANKQRLVLVTRSAVPDPRGKQAIVNDRFTGGPLNGKAGILDKYVFLTADTKDTITLFIDIYNKGAVMVPVGLRYELP